MFNIWNSLEYTIHVYILQNQRFIRCAARQKHGAKLLRAQNRVQKQFSSLFSRWNIFDAARIEAKDATSAKSKSSAIKQMFVKGKRGEWEVEDQIWHSQKSDVDSWQRRCESIKICTTASREKNYKFNYHLGWMKKISEARFVERETREAKGIYGIKVQRRWWREGCRTGRVIKCN